MFVTKLVKVTNPQLTSSDKPEEKPEVTEGAINDNSNSTSSTVMTDLDLGVSTSVAFTHQTNNASSK